MRHTFVPLLMVLFLVSWAARASAQVRAELVVEGLVTPIVMAQNPADPVMQLVGEREGRVRVLYNGVLLDQPYLDLTGSVNVAGECGLLGLIFSPDHATDGRIFITFCNADGDTVLARFTRSSEDPFAADPGSRFDIHWIDAEAWIPQPTATHKGGNLAFGPDGYLYLALGDGGPGNDPEHNAQNPALLLGKMLRIDVGVDQEDADGYDVPPDNPYVGVDGVRPEIWAFGFRNPWRFSFDSPAHGGTGAIVIGDVGQSGAEEIDYEPALAGGRNYGWRNREGTNDHITDLDPFSLPLTDPIFAYDHTVGHSITGGYVYRGASIPDVAGRYFFADFIFNRVWSLGLSIDGSGEAAATTLVEHTSDLEDAANGIASFGVDAAGEVYLISYTTGRIFRLVSSVPPPPPPPPPHTPPLDLDADDLGDVFVYSAASGIWAVESSLASGGFTGLNGGWAPGWEVAFARFNGDDFDDVFVFNTTSGQWFKLLNSGAGFATSGTGTWWPGWQRHVLDLDGDGFSDLFLYDPATGVWFKCLSDSGGFACQQGGWSPGWSVIPARLNLDGNDDLFLWNAATGQWYFALGTNGAGFEYPVTGFWSTQWTLHRVDADGNGLSDFLLHDPATGQYFVARSDLTQFVYSAGAWTLGWSPHIGDLDGDGREDVFLHNPANGQWFELRSDGAGGLDIVGSGVWSLGWEVHLADMNDDGRADVLLYNPPTGQWFQGLNLAFGSFAYTSGFWEAGLDVHVRGPW